MYTVPHLPSRAKMEGMYSMNDTLRNERNMSNPKKENIFHSVFNAWNMIWENFSKVPASFIQSINYPLSVTVVHNEGILPQEFFKDLRTKGEPLNIDSVFIQDAPIKEPLNIVDNIQYSMFDDTKPHLDKIYNENVNGNLKISHKYIKIEDKNTERSDGKESVAKIKDKNNKNSCNTFIPVENSSKPINQYVWVDVNTQEVCTVKNFYNSDSIHNQNTGKKEQLSNCTDSCTDNKKAINTESVDANRIDEQTVKQPTVSNLFVNMWHKVIDSVTDRFCRTDSIPMDLTMNRSYSSKQRKKLNTAAKGRGRGRARSQLRRSGVSQTRHRKEHTKHELDIDIQSDLESWLEFEMYDTNESKEFEGCFSANEDTIDGLDTSEFVIQEAVEPVTFTFADIKPKMQKLKAGKTVDQGIYKYSGRMKSIPECTEQTDVYHSDYFEKRYTSQKNTFRPRLMSESSIDSEDSYCIVFENGSEVTCKSDLDDFEESDTDESSEYEVTQKNDKPASPLQKVKFNLKPTIHVMVQWDYAYRAARRGPWEQMGRDRVRFRGRINCIERVLNPILTVQHRTHIWQQRFACND